MAQLQDALTTDIPKLMHQFPMEQVLVWERVSEGGKTGRDWMKGSDSEGYVRECKRIKTYFSPFLLFSLFYLALFSFCFFLFAPLQQPAAETLNPFTEDTDPNFWMHYEGIEKGRYDSSPLFSFLSLLLSPFFILK